MERHERMRISIESIVESDIGNSPRQKQLPAEFDLEAPVKKKQILTDHHLDDIPTGNGAAELYNEFFCSTPL